jgi:hypothetical protein
MWINCKHRIGKAFPAVLCLSLSCGLVFGTNTARAESVPAQPAYNFVNSVGLSTYFGWPESPYRTSYAEVKARLAELGVRHVRDGASNWWATSALRDLYLTLGVRTLAIVDLRTGSGAQQRLDPSRIKSHLDMIRTTLGTAPLVGIEGPNEYNTLERVYGYTEWPTDLRRFQEQLYGMVSTHPDFVARKILQPSLGGPNSALYYARMGDYSNIADIGNLHIYPNWFTWEKAATREYDGAQDTMPGRPFWSTETGWHSAITGQSLDAFTTLRYLPRITRIRLVPEYEARVHLSVDRLPPRS